MTEGWQKEDYLILFDERESADLSLRYELNKYLVGYEIVGLKGWDDFIIEGVGGRLFTIPTVPLAPDHLSPLGFAIDHGHLRQDNRVRGRIKWYTTPLIFGGDPTADANMAWVDLEQHIQLVNWWNRLYQTVKDRSAEKSR